MSVYKKLTAARVKLHAMELNKSGMNDYSKYKYFELCDFIKSIQNIFSDVGLCGVVSFGADIATLTITDVDDGKEIVISSPMVTAELKGTNAMQNLGASQTYLRRYLWVVAMEIVENDVIDSNGAAEKKTLEAKNTPAKKLDENPTPTVNSDDSKKIMDEFKWKIEISQGLEELAKVMVEITNTKQCLTKEHVDMLRGECGKKKLEFQPPIRDVSDLIESI